MECSVGTCGLSAYRKGLCYRHYNEDVQKDKPKCSVDGCELKCRGRQPFCNDHYRLERRKVAPHCKVVGCTRPAVARGLCDSHRKREDKYGSLDSRRPADWGGKENHPLMHSWRWIIRNSTVCDEWQDFWIFAQDMGGDRPSHMHRLDRRDRTRPHSKENSFWKEKISVKGESEKEYMRNYARAHREKNPDYYKDKDLQKRFGISLSTYNEMLAAQGGNCAICGGQETARHPKTHKPMLFAVDHCHTSGNVRGLLCGACNALIGYARDNEQTLLAAIEYLRKHR